MNARGEHYAKKIMELDKFLTAVIYPAVGKNLKQAFPEFGWKRSPEGYWVAGSAPVNYSNYGHRQGKLIGTGWGFRSMTTGEPAVLWINYLNKKKFPTGHTLGLCVKKLAEKAKVTYAWEPTAEDLRATEIQERRDHLLEAFLAFAQGQLSGDLGKYARAYLSRGVGLPPNRLPELELGFYPSADEVRYAIHDAGYDTEEDDNFAEVLGLYHPKWEGRIVGPWWDREGRRVINLWGRFPGETPVDQAVFVNLNRPDPNSPFGGKEVPILLHDADRMGKKNFVLLESPLKALLARSLGLVDPFPISSGGPIVKGQVAVLSELLKRSGSLTLNCDYDPAAADIHADTCRVLDAIGNVPFQLFVVDPVEMAGKGSHVKVIDAASFIRTKGIQSYKALLSKRVPYHNYRGHTHVREQNKVDFESEDSSAQVIESIEGFVGTSEDRQRAPELDRLYDDAFVRSNGDDVDYPEPEASSEAPEPGAGSGTSPVEKILKDAQSLAGLIGTDRAKDYLQSELSNLLGAGAGDGFVPTEEVAAKAAPHRSVENAPKESRALADNIKKGFEGLAESVSSGKVTPQDAIGILLKCQEGIQALLASLYDSVNGKP